MSVILVSIIILLLLFVIYQKTTDGVCRSKKTLEGKTVIITGANRGIGLETARDLTRRKARVVLACRNLGRGREALNDIKRSTGKNNVILMHLDTSSLESVRNFAKEFKSNEPKLDVLIHNAAVGADTHKLTEDKLNYVFATNHFGHFLLTHLLLDLLKASPAGRIVVVSSDAHWGGSLDLKAIECGKLKKGNLWIYSDTKLANVLFARELSRRLQGTNVTVNALHPGVVRTHLGDGMGWLAMLIKCYPFLKTPVMGAQTSIYLAVADDVNGVSGKYFRDCRISGVSSAAKDRKLAADFWELSEKLTGLKKY